MPSKQQTIPELDKLDYSIVELLSADPHWTNRSVADRLEIAESTCAYRIRRLRSTGVIKPSKLNIDYALFGYTLQAVIIVYLSNHSREAVEHFMQSMAKAPFVTQVMHLTGRSDFMVTVTVPGREELKNFVLDHVTVHPVVRGTETHVVFDVREGDWIPTHRP